MSEYLNYNGITLYKGVNRLDIGCTDNLQKKIPVIIKEAVGHSEGGAVRSLDNQGTTLYPNKCYWLINVPYNGTILLNPVDSPVSELNDNITISTEEQGTNEQITFTSSWVEPSHDTGLANVNVIESTVSEDVAEFKLEKSREDTVNSYIDSQSEGMPLYYPPSYTVVDPDNNPYRGYATYADDFTPQTSKEKAIPFVSSKYDSRFKAEHLKEEITELLNNTSEQVLPPEMSFATPHNLVEYYVIFAPNGTNTISLPDGYYYANNPSDLHFEQDASGPTAYEIHICNNIVRIGKAVKFNATPYEPGPIVA